MPLTGYYNKKENVGYLDYIEGATNRGLIYMGSITLPMMLEAIDDLERKKKDSLYYCCVFRPELRGESVTREKNAAFWAGAIDASREFLLVNPIRAYCNSRKNSLGIVNSTQRELVWLYNNGYDFKESETYPGCMLAIPPNKDYLRKDNYINLNINVEKAQETINQIINIIEENKIEKIPVEVKKDANAGVLEEGGEIEDPSLDHINTEDCDEIQSRLLDCNFTFFKDETQQMRSSDIRALAHKL